MPDEFKADPADPDARHSLSGTWVTSFSAFVHDNDESGGEESGDTPRIAAYNIPNTARRDTGGYFLAATILCLKLDRFGEFTGYVDINRGGAEPPQNVVRGTWEISSNAELDAFEGRIFALYPYSGTPPDPTKDVHMTYYFVVKDWNEIEWLRKKSTRNGGDFRHNIARGTMRRVTVHPSVFVDPNL